jgi:hypothetical protein
MFFFSNLALFFVMASLLAGEKLLSCGFVGDVSCSFCRGCIENVEHLFFGSGPSGFNARLHVEGSYAEKFAV